MKGPKINNSMLKTLVENSGYISHEVIKGTFKGKPVKYIHVYMKNRLPGNPYGLDTFTSDKGSGYLIDITPKPRKTAKSGLKATATSKRKKTVAKPKKKVVKKKAVAKKAKPTRKTTKR